MIKQMQIMTVDSSGAPDVISCGADSGKYLAGPGTSSEVFTAPYDLKEIKIVMIYSGTEPVYEMAFAGLIPTTVPAGLCGDANCDDKINVADAVAILQYIANNSKYRLTDQGLRNADADGVPGITGGDAIAVQKKDAGLVDKLPLM